MIKKYKRCYWHRSNGFRRYFSQYEHKTTRGTIFLFKSKWNFCKHWYWLVRNLLWDLLLSVSAALRLFTWCRVLILKCRDFFFSQFVSFLSGLKLHHEADSRHSTGVWRRSVVTLRHWGHVTYWNEARAVFMWAPPALQLVSGSRHRAEFTGHLEALWSHYRAAWRHGKYERCGSNEAPTETVISHHARLQHCKHKCHTAKPSGADTHFLLKSSCVFCSRHNIFSSLLLFELL